MKVIGKTKDYRTNTPIIYAIANIEEYLKIIGTDFENYIIQRRRVKHKAYTRMKSDILEGALLPTITLAVKPNYVDALKKAYNDNNDLEIENLLVTENAVNILDGLQRTFILKEISEEGMQLNSEQTLLLEFWLEDNMRHLIYRIIILNAGQKPMSMRHQIELLFSTLKEKLEAEINGLELFTEREGQRRSRAKKYSLDRIVTGYQSYITQSPEISKDNFVAQKIIEDNAFDKDENNLLDDYDDFIK